MMKKIRTGENDDQIKNKQVLARTFTKMHSSLSGKDVYDKKGSKMQVLYKKNDPNVHGEELYDKNGNN